MATMEPRRGTATSEREPSELDPLPEVEEAFEEIEVDAPRVGIIMGSASDKPTMQPAGEELKQRGIRFEVRVISAHRDPDAVADYARNAHMRGLRVIIAGAGLSAAWPSTAPATRQCWPPGSSPAERQHDCPIHAPRARPDLVGAAKARGLAR